MATQASDTANNTATKKARAGSGDELAVIAQRAQAFTNASGVAIALSEGNADEIVCRARSGASAPDVGTSLRVEGTFTGLCIQSGKELRCDDCETDTRVDTAAIRALNIRSMVVTPIREDNRVTGVLAVFAPTPHAFTITHVAVLKTMADQISALLQRERRAREEGLQAEPVRPPAPVAVAKPVVAAPATVTPPPVVIKPAPVAAVRTTPPMAPKAEPVKSTPMEVVPLAAPTRREEKRQESQSRSHFGTLETVAAEEKKPGNKIMVAGIAAVVLLAAAGTFMVLKMQKSGSNASAQHAQEAANVPAPPVSSSGPVQPGTPSSGNAVANAPVVTASVTASEKGKPAAEGESTRKSAKTAEKNSATAEKPAPAEKSFAVATAGSGPSRISQNSSAAPETAPSFTMDSGSAPLSTLARPVASSTPSAAAIEQSQLEPLQLTRQTPPVYPAIAKARHITGAVVIEVKVGKDGKVSNPRFVSGPPIFKDSAFDAVLKYQFKPARLNGQPIDQTTQIKLIFHE